MFGLSLNLSCSRVAVLGLALGVSPAALAQEAQVAPPVGDHAGARASDTGFADAVNSSGGYQASVPLDLPKAKGDLPVPVSVVYGGNRFGAAGLRWDVPFSSIHRHVSIANRRPANIPEIAPQPREQVSLSFDGGSYTLVRNAENTAWFAQRGGEQLEVRDAGGGVLNLYDGGGLTYVFSSDGGGAGALDNGNFYLLRDIIAPGNKVHLDYSFGTPSLGGGSAGLSIDLASVSYNYDSTGSCAKHQVSMFYDSDAPAPVSISMLGTTPLVRLHHLFAVVVFARESANNSSQPCSGAVKALRGYNLNYQNDADTGQLQLSQVTMFGKDDTPERFINLPVATYSYGSVTPNNKLTYVTSQLFSSGLPSDFDKRFGLALTDAQTSRANIYGDDANGRSSITYTYNYTRQNILDVNGDGRGDLLYYDFSDTHGNHMKAAFNSPAPGGGSQFTPIGSGRFPPVNSRTFSNFTVSSSDFLNPSEVYEQSIDFDGDGRLDYVNAHEVLDAWAVYLNKPDAVDPKRTVWQRRLIDIRPLKPLLASANLRGHGLPAAFEVGVG